MIPRRVVLENFLSIAGPVDVCFTDDEPLWVLTGRNGVGKSAIFDAITYCLYGEHRGGGQKADQLIRHGANGFRLILEFEFAGAEYRITRTRVIRGRTTQRVERRTGPGAEDWEAEPGVGSAAEVRAWVERTLGLEYDAFTTSVLLRQGESEKLFKSSRAERIAVLKRIIGFEDYEHLSERVHTQATLRKGVVETLRRRLEAVPEVTPPERTAAAAALAAALQAQDGAQAALRAAVRCVEQAKQWARLGPRRADLLRKMAEADARAKEAESLRAAKARLDDLMAAVPVLQSICTLRKRLADLDERERLARASRERQTADCDAKAKAADIARRKAESHRQAADDLDRQAKNLHEQIERSRKFLTLADEVERLQQQIQAYPADLAEQLAESGTAEEKAAQTVQTVTKELSRIQAFLHLAQQQQGQFATVQVGAKCSRCGQNVDAEHAAQECSRLADEVQRWEEEVGRLQTALREAQGQHSSAKKQWVALEKKQQALATLQTTLRSKQESLTHLGMAESAARLRRHLEESAEQRRGIVERANAERRDYLETHEEANRLQEEWTALKKGVARAGDEIHSLSNQRATAHGQEQAAAVQLAAEWQSRVQALAPEDVAALAEERDRLVKAGVAIRFTQWREDVARRVEWENQLQEIEVEIATIPDGARLPVPDAEQQQQEASWALAEADATRTAAQRICDELADRARQYGELSTQLRDAERQTDLHKRIDDLLGPEGLQRELVRLAEEEIISLANDTLQKLTDGELSLELDEEAAGRDDKAFALRVRRVGDPHTIGVLFLSGSQKFRVAVSVALAVGRFASGRARPLEAVIIDEGFGSLDQEGLRAMAEELKRLQRSQSLRRIILVSHQEDFTEQFPVGYRLIPGPNGTTAEPFRR